MQGKRVVICEDEGIALMQFSRTLERSGLLVVGQATTGPQAVEVVLHERPDLVLMDLSMPGMSGLEASRNILDNYPVCILLLTGHDRADVEPEAIEIGISGFLAKPVMSDQLLKAIAQALEKFSG